MSAVNAIVTADGDRAYILTDTATYSQQDRVILRWTSKAVPIPHARACFCATGHETAVEIAWQFIKGFSDFDAMEDGFQAILSARFKTLRTLRKFAAWARFRRAPQPTLNDPNSVTIFLVGFSERFGRMRALWASSDSTPSFSPNVADIILSPDLNSPMRTPDRACADDLPAALLQYMHWQRNHVVSAKAGSIGGAAVLTIMDRVGIWSGIIHQWKDKIGEEVNMLSGIPPRFRIVTTFDPKRAAAGGG